MDTPYILTVLGSNPDSGQTALLVRDTLGHNTVHVDLRHMRDWMLENDPAAFIPMNPEESPMLDLSEIDPAALRQYLACARPGRLSNVGELGCLIDANQYPFAYAAQVPWQSVFGYFTGEQMAVHHLN